MNALDVFAEARPDVEIDDEVLADIAADVFEGRTSGGPRWRVLGVAAAVIALVAGLALVVGRPERTAPADTVPPAIPDDGEPLRMLPSDLDGAEVIGFLSGPETSTIPSTVLARPAGGGSYIDKVVVRRGPADELLVETGDPAALGESEVEPFSTRGRAWDVVSDEPLGWVFGQHDLGDGTALTVAIESTEDVAGGRDTVIAVATSLSNVAQPPQGVAFDPLPAGLEVIADWAVSNSWVRYASVHAVDGSITKVITHTNDDAFLPGRLMGDDLRPFTVRGQAGFATTYLGMQRIIWQEAPGQWVVVESATGGTVDELATFAESLRVISPEEWDRVVEPPGDLAGTPATTAPAVALPGSVPPATSAPQTAPPGRLLVANAAGVGGVAGQWSTSFEVQGADVLEPVNAITPNGEPAAVTRVVARPGFETLGAWVAEQFGVAVEPFDALDPATIEGDVSGADVVAVVGRANVDPALVEPPPAAPAGRVLVANASQLSGLAGQYSTSLAGSGADVLDPVSAGYDGGTTARTVIFARPDAYELAEWVRDEVGVELIQPFDDIGRFSWEVPGDLSAADVLVVLGLDKTPPDVAASRPVVFGDDSVIMSAVDALDERGYLVNAEVSRPFDSLVFEVLTVVTALGPQVLVLHVGTTGPIGRRELTDLLDRTADVPNVILVNAHGDRDWIAANNALLAEVDQPGDNLILMDWDALADQCAGECFASDGIHLTDAGVAYFVERLADITGM